MLQTYKATLNGNMLEWNDEIPEAAQSEKSVSVFITILEAEETTDLRPFGLAAREFVVPEDFDAPLPDEVLADFEGK
jgi:hypothetical protein